MQALRDWTINSAIQKDAAIKQLQTQLEDLKQRLNELECQIPDLSAIAVRALALSRDIGDIRCSADSISALTELLRR